jgi:hypothetical protein
VVTVVEAPGGHSWWYIAWTLAGHLRITQSV